MTQAPPAYAPGALVNVRGRDWVVLPPGDDPDVLLLRPLGGSEEDVAGIYLPLEQDDLRSTTLDLPDERFVGDGLSARLLRDAVRLGLRSGAGPLRSLARIAVEPRPYQMVPLLMALKQDPVRILIGDDVGIGKTIEAALIARELLDRGEIRRLAVLCPPHLCAQWQAELATKFHMDATVVRPGTVAGLQRQVIRQYGSTLTHGIFDVFPFVVVSIDYIKGDRRRAEFVQGCPECVIVDEAHGVAQATARGSGQQQRHSLVAELAADPGRHVIFATATPHSGDQSAFASLIGLLDPGLEAAVVEMNYAAGTATRQRLAEIFVQRRRPDIRRYLEKDTAFPERLVAERTYTLTPAYRSLLERIVAYAREVIKGAEGGSAFRQRVSWWAALALLRCVSSSPAAAAAALRTRAPSADDPNAADRLGMASVLDLDQAEGADQDDSNPAADTILGDEPTSGERGRLLRLAREADELGGAADPKLKLLTTTVTDLLKDGFSPIVFCRYVATAHYVKEWLEQNLRGGTVGCVTGELPPEAREYAIEELGAHEKRVLVATDCLSEGTNLQENFDAVVHYDLAWNPTRHEQREGRVDRYGQRKPEVRTVVLYGQDNRVDGVVLEVLLRKAENIRRTLGVSVPVPMDTDKVLQAIFDQLFERGATDFRQLELFADQQRDEVAAAWDRAADREKQTRAIFAQHALKPEEVAPELIQAAAAIGSGADVEEFLVEAARRLGAPPTDARGALELDLSRFPLAVQSRAAIDSTVRIGFEPTAPKGVTYVPRTHPLVEALGGYLVDTALDLPAEAVARRAGAIRTNAVSERTVLLLLRGRYLIHQRVANARSANAPSAFAQGSGDVIPSVAPGEPSDLLAEEALLAGFRGDLTAPQWLSMEDAEELGDAQPTANVPPGQASLWVAQVKEALPGLSGALDALAKERADALLQAHRRVRSAAGLRVRNVSVEAKLPLDVLGIYVLMPAPVA